MELVEGIYRFCAEFQKHEVYGLASQLQRAAVSIPSNIAEGRERQSDRDFVRFMAMALGSLAEVETQLLVSQRLGYLKQADLLIATEQADEIGKMLRGLHKTLSNTN